MKIDFTNFNPTYNELEQIIQHYKCMLGISEDYAVQRKIDETEGCLDTEMADRHNTLAMLKILEFSLKYSMMNTKIRKFGNVTLETIMTELDIAKDELETLHKYFYASLYDRSVTNAEVETALSAYDEKLAEVRDLTVKIAYIKANYKVKIVPQSDEDDE